MKSSFTVLIFRLFCIKEWAQILPSRCARLINSCQKCFVCSVIAAQGGHTRHSKQRFTYFCPSQICSIGSFTYIFHHSFSLIVYCQFKSARQRVGETVSMRLMDQLLLKWHRVLIRLRYKLCVFFAGVLQAKARKQETAPKAVAPLVRRRNAKTSTWPSTAQVSRQDDTSCYSSQCCLWCFGHTGLTLLFWNSFWPAWCLLLWGGCTSPSMYQKDSYPHW